MSIWKKNPLKLKLPCMLMWIPDFLKIRNKYFANYTVDRIYYIFLFIGLGEGLHTQVLISNGTLCTWSYLVCRLHTKCLGTIFVLSYLPKTLFPFFLKYIFLYVYILFFPIFVWTWLSKQYHFFFTLRKKWYDSYICDWKLSLSLHVKEAMKIGDDCDKIGKHMPPLKWGFTSKYQ